MYIHENANNAQLNENNIVLYWCNLNLNGLASQSHIMI